MADNIYFTYDIPLTNLSIDEQYQLDRIFRNCKKFNDILIEELNKLVVVLEERLSEHKKEYAILSQKIKETDGNNVELECKRQDIIDKMNNIKKIWLEENEMIKGGTHRLDKFISDTRREYGFDGKIPSLTAIVIGMNLNKSLEKYLFGNGKRINFKPYFDFTYITSMAQKHDFIINFADNTLTLKPGFFRDSSISQKNKRKKHWKRVERQYQNYCNHLKDGETPIPYDKWKKKKENQLKLGLYSLTLPLYINKNDAYIQDCVQNSDFRYAGLKRKLKNGRWTYYVCITAKGKSPVLKEKQLLSFMVEELTNTYEVKIDIYGPEVILFAKSNDEEKTESFELGYESLVKRMETLSNIDRYMENSRISTNPDCYQEDGQKIKGQKIHTRSKGYNDIRAKRKYQFDCHSETLKNRYNHLAKYIVTHYGANISVEIIKKEDMNVREKKNERRSVLKYSQMTFIHALEKIVADIGIGKVNIIKNKNEQNNQENIEDNTEE